jgi:hypothetical protein
MIHDVTRVSITKKEQKPGRKSRGRRYTCLRPLEKRDMKIGPGYGVTRKMPHNPPLNLKLSCVR